MSIPHTPLTPRSQVPQSDFLCWLSPTDSSDEEWGLCIIVLLGDLFASLTADVGVSLTRGGVASVTVSRAGDVRVADDFDDDDDDSESENFNSLRS